MPRGGWPCGCDCGDEIYAGEFVCGQEQTAPHQRVAQVGTISEFLRWFDAVGPTPTWQPGQRPRRGEPAGQFDLSIGDDGSVCIQFAPA